MSLQGKVIYYILTGARKSKDAIQNIVGLRALGAKVYVIPTDSAVQFVSPEELQEVSGNFVRTSFRKSNPEESLPLEDLVVVAPATYNTVNKIAHGIADNLATSLVATAIGRRIPVYVAPNMNYDLWNSPITQKSVEWLKELGVRIVHPQVEDGKSTMAETLKVFDSIVHDFVRIRYGHQRMIDEGQLRQQLVDHYFSTFQEIGERLERLQVSGSTAGCISHRIEKGFLITASGSRLGQLTKDDITMVLSCDEHKNFVEWCGKEPPSSETPLHFKIYEQRVDVKAVLHTHCAELTYSPLLKPYRTSRYYSYGTFEFGSGITNELGARNAIIAKDHGQIVSGSNLEDAYLNLVRLFDKCNDINT